MSSPDQHSSSVRVIRPDLATDWIPPILGAAVAAVLSAIALEWTPILGVGELAAKSIALSLSACTPVLAFVGLRRLREHRRIRGSVLRLSPASGVVGGTLSGRIELPPALAATSSIALELRCSRWTRQGAGDREGFREELLWQDAFRLEPIGTAEGSKIAEFAVALPSGLPASTVGRLGQGFDWNVEATLLTGGIERRISWTVPVRAKVDRSVQDDLAPRSDLLERSSEAVTPGRPWGRGEEQVTADGMELTFPPTSFLDSLRSLAMPSIIVAALWFFGEYFIEDDSIWIFRVGVLTIGGGILLLFWALLRAQLRVTVNREEVRTRWSVDGMPVRTTRVPRAQILGVTTELGNVVIRTANGRDRLVARELGGPEEVRYAAETFARRASLPLLSEQA
jgi:hypothetical protein